MHLVVPAGGSFRETRRIDLDARVLTVGRAEGCDVRIDLPGVDDQHAKISEVALIAIGPDCAVGDVPLDAGQRRLIAPGDEIQVGSVVLALDGTDPESAKGAAPRAGPRIRVVEGQNFGAELILAMENREYILGRSPKVDLVLEDREVSREHLKIVRRGFAVFIYDQASTRGSWLGRSAVYQGSRIEWERSRMLKIGATVLALDLPEAVRRSAAPAQVSAPMTPPPRVPRAAERAGASAPPPARPVVVDPGPPPANIVAYHYEAVKQPSVAPLAPSVPPSGPPQQISPPPHAYAATGSLPPPSSLSPTTSLPPPRKSAPSGPRTAWKKTGPTIGRASGLLLLAVAGIAILGVLFVVFSLME